MPDRDPHGWTHAGAPDPPFTGPMPAALKRSCPACGAPVGTWCRKVPRPFELGAFRLTLHHRRTLEEA